ncbi:MAG: hypothetical protein ACJ79S_05820 [Gemmatimonadaceae bacterium]
MWAKLLSTGHDHGSFGSRSAASTSTVTSWAPTPSTAALDVGALVWSFVRHGERETRA